MHLQRLHLGQAMTAPTPLVESVARAISQWMNGARLPSPPNWDRLQEATRQAYLDQAQAALDACHVEELESALRDLLAAMQSLPVVILTGPIVDAVEASRTVLAKLDGKLAERPV